MSVLQKLTSSNQITNSKGFILDYPTVRIGNSLIVNADCFEWLNRIPEESVHGVVTDPPYGVKEYNRDQLEKRANGKGGIWRIPPSFDGHERSPLPRFTALSDKEKHQIKIYFKKWAELIHRVLKPGGHVFIASNAYLSQLVFASLVEGGLEFRGEVIRLVQTLRGGDRPKNAEIEFNLVSSLPRSCYEPWGIFRKPFPKRLTVSDCLRKYKTGGLRRNPDGSPFLDVIRSTRTPKIERGIATHPSLKPQSFLRKIVYSVLPLGEGILVDPFMGSGSTIAAAEFLGLVAVGIERFPEFFEMAKCAIPALAKISAASDQQSIFTI